MLEKERASIRKNLILLKRYERTGKYYATVDGKKIYSLDKYLKELETNIKEYEEGITEIEEELTDEVFKGLNIKEAILEGLKRELDRINIILKIAREVEAENGR